MLLQPQPEREAVEGEKKSEVEAVEDHVFSEQTPRFKAEDAQVSDSDLSVDLNDIKF